MATLLDDQMTACLEVALDEGINPITRLEATTRLIGDLHQLTDHLAESALTYRPLREVAAASGHTLGTAHRRWGHLIPTKRRRR